MLNHRRDNNSPSLWKGKILIPYWFYRFSLVVSLLGSVIPTPPLSNAYQLATTATHQETIAGRLLSIDYTTGRFLVETDTGIIEVESTPAAIAGWKAGDPVVVQIEPTARQADTGSMEKATPLSQSGATATSDTAIAR